MKRCRGSGNHFCPLVHTCLPKKMRVRDRVGGKGIERYGYLRKRMLAEADSS